MLKPGDVITFDKEKNFTHVRSLGRGGTGDAHLFKDETTDMVFAIKRYSPIDSNYIEEYYERFVDEIKILFLISHPNIVRVYNYYLYPEHKRGYLQMEYIDGKPIDEFVPFISDWEEIFTKTISAFEYLESKKILHRDIRPANILIDKEENVKVIDFGFGKKLIGENQDGRSVLLNWPVTQLPNETEDEGIYNHQSEIYFVGKLFSSILGEGHDSFKFQPIINRMIELDPNARYSSFRDISVAVSEGALAENFIEEEKNLYRNFASILSGYLTKHKNSYEPVKDPNTVLSRLSSLIRYSSLEEYIQDNAKLINCFIDNDYSYKTRNDIFVSEVADFYRFLVGLTLYQQKIVLDNIEMRLSQKEIEYDLGDDLPF
ncbi:protein kinase family protein [Halobacillus ihumii]|uniref:protein kinase family protein n=1 Tax=Halobacillus ihumii TaxID=2686092 RepID=UPI0013CFC6D4|nr:protein kinase family protein [Halobacillus ihumii]